VASDDGVPSTDESALGDTELFTDQVEASDFFRDGVFHLKASVDLEELYRAVRANQKFTRSRANITDLFEDIFRCRIQQVTLCVGGGRARGLLRRASGGDVATSSHALKRQLRFPCGRLSTVLHHVGFVEVLLDKTFTATERGDSLARCGLELFGNFLCVRATLSPRPPPPNAALMATGSP